MARDLSRKRGKHPRKRADKVRRPSRQSTSRQTVREWVNSLVFAFTAMLFLHMFIFQPFVVPTPSMANTVLPGEYLIVSKLHYGPQTPGIVGIPYTDFYLKNVTIPTLRLPGFSAVNRGDVVVFHYPPELEFPVDRRQPYLKRALGLPGEKFEFRDKHLFIDGEAVADYAGIQQFWDIYKTDPRVNLSTQKLKATGVEEIIPLRDPAVVRIIATREAATEIDSWPYVARVESFVDKNTSAHAGRLFPAGHLQTPDNYGPLWIPAAGENMPLNDESWTVYGATITQHEPGQVTRKADGTFTVDGVPATTYVFKQDYYFMVGDNRDNSLDSRFWGFVPENHIMGKAVARFYSWDKEARWPRFHRMFEVIR